MLADHPFVAVGLALDAVLRRAAFFRKEARDGVAASRRAAVAPIRRELDGLADGKFMFGHVLLRQNRRRPDAPETEQRAAHGVGRDYSARRFTAEVLPCWPRSSSKLSFWPSRRLPIPDRSTAEMWTKTSFEPSSG